MRRLLTASLTALLSLSAASARADKASCVAAHVKGQQSQRAGRLTEAREAFLVCSADGCPNAVRKDCVHWVEEVSNSIPTVVLGAKDRGGRDVFDVKVTVDGAPLVDKLDGKSVAVDPGAHNFRFESPGMPPVTQKVLVKEGDRARPVDVVFEGGAPAPTPPTAKVDPKGPGKDDKPGGATVTTDKKGPGILPWVVMGVGGIGVVGGAVYALTAPALPSGCDGARQTCTQFEGESQDSFDSRRDQAGKHDTQATTGLIIAAGGGVVLAAGVVWYLVAPSSSPAPAPKRGSAVRGPAGLPLVTPWVSPQGGGGVSAVATF